MAKEKNIGQAEGAEGANNQQTAQPNVPAVPIVAPEVADDTPDTEDPLIAELKAQLEDWRDKYVQAEADNQTLEAINKELTLQVEELSAAGAKTAKPGTTPAAAQGFTRNGKNYAFNFQKAVLKTRGKITSVEVLADEALQDELIASGSMMIREEEEIVASS